MVPTDISYPLDHLLSSGVDVSISRSGFSVSSSSRVVVRQNPRRVGLVIQLTTPEAIRVGPFPDVSTTRGFLLPGYGSYLSVDLRDYALPSLGWFAAPTGFSLCTCLVIEYLLSREVRSAGGSSDAN